MYFAHDDFLHKQDEYNFKLGTKDNPKQYL